MNLQTTRPQGQAVREKYQREFDMRFWARVNILSFFGCWEWLGNKNQKGYGIVSKDNKLKRAHRISYEQHFGAVPKGKMLAHFCDNPSCVNPMHLAPATAKENTADMIHKGRANFKNNLPNLRSKK